MLSNAIDRTLTDLLPDKHQYEPDYQLYLDYSLPPHPDIPTTEVIQGNDLQNTASEDGSLEEGELVTKEKAANAEIQEAKNELLEADRGSSLVTSPQLRDVPHLTPKSAEVMSDEEAACRNGPFTELQIAKEGNLASYKSGEASEQCPMTAPRPTAEAAAEAEALPHLIMLRGIDGNKVKTHSIPGLQQEPQHATELPVSTDQADTAESTWGVCQSADSKVQSITVQFSQQKGELAKLRAPTTSPALHCPVKQHIGMAS